MGEQLLIHRIEIPADLTSQRGGSTVTLRDDFTGAKGCRVRRGKATRSTVQLSNTGWVAGKKKRVLQPCCRAQVPVLMSSPFSVRERKKDAGKEKGRTPPAI